MRVGQTNSTAVQANDAATTKKSEKAGAAAKAGKSAPAKNASATTILGSTNTEISARGRELAKAKTVAVSAPDVREEKIAELKRRIAEGSYKVDAKAVADKIVDEHIETGGLS